MPRAKGASDPSTEAEIDDKEQAEASAAEGVSSETEDDKKDLLSVVQDAVKKDDQEETPASEATAEEEEASEGDDEKGEASAKSDDEPDEETPEEEKERDAQVPFNKHPRWKKLIKQRNGLRTDLDAANQELEQVRPLADEMINVQSFMKDNQLSPKDVAQGFEIMALVVSNPAEARKQLLGLVDQLDNVTGHALPEDLQKRVDDGDLSEDDARDISTSRASAKLAEGRTKKAEEDREADHKQSLNDTIVSELNAYEEAVAEKDPDYAEVKKPLVDRYVVAHIARNGPSKSVEEAKQVFDAALKDADEYLGKLRPKTTGKKPTRVVTSTSIAGNGADPEPKTLKEAITFAAREGPRA